MATPEVSVIIPTCNRPKLLPAAIRSALSQTYRDFELVVVDDASDHSIDGIVKGFQDDRVRLIRHERRRGGAVARNTGIQNSDGEFVAFLDDDDEWYPEKLARQVAVLLKSNPDIGAVYTGYDVVDRDTGETLSQMLPVHRGDVSSGLLRGNCVGPTSSFLVRRKCFETVGMFDERLPAFQDYDLWIRLSKTYKFDYVPERMFNYYVHSKRIWTNPEVIRKGLDILVEKYGSSKTFKKTCSECYLTVAVQYCESEKSGKARETLRRAIHLHPFDLRYYLYFLLTFLNQATYQRFQEYKTKILGCLAHASGGRFCRR